MIYRAVIDTNILVSSFWSPSGTPSKVVQLVLMGGLVPCFNSSILEEYRAVLMRPAFRFSAADVSHLLKFWQKVGFSVVVQPSTLPMADESDRKFYDVAKTCNALLVTGNAKHYPQEPFVLSAAQLLNTVV